MSRTTTRDPKPLPKVLTCALALLLALAAGGAARAASWVDEVDAVPGGLLVIELPAGGSIDISTWDEQRVAVEAEYHGRDADRVGFELSGGGDRVEVRAEYGGGRRSRGSGGTVRLRVPTTHRLLSDPHAADPCGLVFDRPRRPAFRS